MRRGTRLLRRAGLDHSRFPHEGRPFASRSSVSSCHGDRRKDGRNPNRRSCVCRAEAAAAIIRHDACRARTRRDGSWIPLGLSGLGGRRNKLPARDRRAGAGARDWRCGRTGLQARRCAGKAARSYAGMVGILRAWRHRESRSVPSCAIDFTNHADRPTGRKQGMHRLVSACSFDASGCTQCPFLRLTKRFREPLNLTQG